MERAASRTKGMAPRPNRAVRLLLLLQQQFLVREVGDDESYKITRTHATLNNCVDSSINRSGTGGGTVVIISIILDDRSSW